MIKKFGFIVALVCLMTLSNMANAVVVGFDDLDTSAAGYVDLESYGPYQYAHWDDFWAIDPYHPDVQAQYGNAYVPAIISPQNIAVNVYGGDASILFDTPVDFFSGYFTAPVFTPTYPPYVPVDVTISGTYWDSSTFLFDDFFSLTTEGVTEFVEFNLLGITSITFSPDVSGTPTPHNWFGVDNITYSPVPEPSSTVFGLISLAGLIGSRIRKNKLAVDRT